MSRTGKVGQRGRPPPSDPRGQALRRILYGGLIGGGVGVLVALLAWLLIG